MTTSEHLHPDLPNEDPDQIELAELFRLLAEGGRKIRQARLQNETDDLIGATVN